MHQHVDMEQKEIPFSTVKLSHLRLRYGGENSLLLLPYTLPKAKRHMCVVFTSLQDDKRKSRPERPDSAPLFLNFCNSMQSFSLVCQSIRNLNIHILNNSLWGWEKYSSHKKNMTAATKCVFVHIRRNSPTALFWSEFSLFITGDLSCVEVSWITFPPATHISQDCRARLVFLATTRILLFNRKVFLSRNCFHKSQQPQPVSVKHKHS